MDYKKLTIVIVATSVTVLFLIVPVFSLFLADLVRKSAWPEHHHFSISGDEDGYQTLYGKVKNLGDANAAVSVLFTVTNSTHSWNVETSSTLTTPGQIVDLNTKAISSAPPAALGTGKYSVSARARYDTDGDGTPDTDGAKIKTFSFAVVP